MGLPVPKPTASILLTRPEAQSRSFAQQLQAHGFTGDIQISPLFAIKPTGAAISLNATDQVIFTSRNAIEFVPVSDAAAWCVGEKTAEQAKRAGWSAISANGDVDALAAKIVAANPTCRLVHVRGRHSRGDLVARLNAAGLTAIDVVVYDQVAQSLGDAALAVLNQTDPVIVPLFSPRTARLFADQGPFRAPIHCVAMSDAVAQEVRDLPVQTLRIAAEPTAKSIRKGVLSLVDAA